MHDAHARPPESVRELFKLWRKKHAAHIDNDPDLIDPYNPDSMKVSFTSSIDAPRSDFNNVMNEFCEDGLTAAVPSVDSPARPSFAIKGLPGLQVFPSLLPSRLQIVLLHKLLHRDLSNAAHRTNLHLHHRVAYPETSLGVPSSFFAASRNGLLRPKEPTVHKPITYGQMLESKLRWITLGGQYDWTNKVYPEETPPQFPPDIAVLLKHLFPEMDAQAAIVNFYSPADTLSVHRDVSEECDRPLVSISLGCDGIFLVSDEDGNTVAAIRLRSGDAVLMSGASRYAWHGVPKILANTCPPWLQDWPDFPQDGPYQDWRGWMSNKRINLNVRQMTETRRI